MNACMHGHMNHHPFPLPSHFPFPPPSPPPPQIACTSLAAPADMSSGAHHVHRPRHRWLIPPPPVATPPRPPTHRHLLSSYSSRSAGERSQRSCLGSAAYCSALALPRKHASLTQAGARHGRCFRGAAAPACAGAPAPDSDRARRCGGIHCPEARGAHHLAYHLEQSRLHSPEEVWG